MAKTPQEDGNNLYAPPKSEIALGKKIPSLMSKLAFCTIIAVAWFTVGRILGGSERDGEIAQNIHKINHATAMQAGFILSTPACTGDLANCSGGKDVDYELALQIHILQEIIPEKKEITGILKIEEDQ